MTIAEYDDSLLDSVPRKLPKNQGMKERVIV